MRPILVPPSGTLTTLHSFCSQSACADGQYPTRPLIQATDGNLYGTTAFGETQGSGGTIFTITLGGRLTTLYSFCSQSGCADGQQLESVLVQATGGNLCALFGGISREGTVPSN